MAMLANCQITAWKQVLKYEPHQSRNEHGTSAGIPFCHPLILRGRGLESRHFLPLRKNLGKSGIEKPATSHVAMRIHVADVTYHPSG